MPTVSEIITENIIKQLEQGVAPFRWPSRSGLPSVWTQRHLVLGAIAILLALPAIGLVGGSAYVIAKKGNKISVLFDHQ